MHGNDAAQPTTVTDLAELLARLGAARRPGEYVYVALPLDAAVPAEAEASIVEDEARTIVVRRDVADAAGLPYDFVAAWLTLTVHSSLTAVGLTAAFSRALDAAGISCNVLAGFHHDHILVPVEDADRALAALQRLPSPPASTSSALDRSSASSIAVDYSFEPPSAEEFKTLYDSTGWADLDLDVFTRALAGTWLVCTARDAGSGLAAMGRVISDGSLHALVTEMIVRDDVRGQTVGTTLLEHLVTETRRRGVEDIQLFAARGRAPFYERNGFRSRPADAPGMDLAP